MTSQGVTPTPSRQSRFLDEVARRVLIYDGAMGTSIHEMRLSKDDFGGREGPNELIVLTRPDKMTALHESFLDAGADIVETNSFQGSRLRFAEWGVADQTYEINRAAAALARRAADKYSTAERPRFVAGSIGPTGMLPSADDPTLSDIAFAELVAVGEEQARALLDGGADLILLETQQDLLETKAMIFGARQAMANSGRWVPIQCQPTLDMSGRMLLGTDIAAALTTLEALGVDLIGLNCSTGPDYMREPIRYLAEHTRLPITCIPNAGLPINVDGEACYPMEPEPMARELTDFVEQYGVSVVGGCCGSTPEHIEWLVKLVGDRPPKERPVEEGPRVSSAIRAVAMHQDPRPLLIGERVNSQGSRIAKRALLRDDYDRLVRIARQQVDSGAHVLDVCVALTERADEPEQMRQLVKKLAMSSEAPLVIDTTEVDVVQAALETYPGRAILNSINLENRAERIDKWLPLMKVHGAAAIAMCIDERGQATDATWKYEAAEQIYNLVVSEYDLPPDSLIFDALVFPISTGQAELRTAAVETLEGIRRIKTGLSGVLTVLGISNLSFGLSPHPRAVLNSVFLYHAVAAGLDMAIVNPRHVFPYADIPEEERALSEDLIFNRREDALARFIQHFEEHASSDLPGAEEADPTEGMTAEQKVHYQIVHRQKEGVEDLIDDALTRQGPVEVLNNVLLPAMKEVGDKFGAGELILPFVLQSAEVMKKAVAHVEQFLDRREGVTKGKVVLATVYGDVHDIGKNLVNTILSNNGYTVYDLGKQVPVTTIVDKAVEVGADAIGLSALLVVTSKQMPANVQELHRRKLHIPVLVGGAAINRRFGQRINWIDEQAEVSYDAGVFYCRDAFEGLETVDALVDQERRPALLDRLRREAEAQLTDQTAPSASADATSTTRSPTLQDVPIPEPPFWGYRVLRGPESIPFAEVFSCLDRNALFRGQWGYRGHREEWQALVERELEPRLEALQQEAVEAEWLRPRVIYGYYPCNAQGNDLVLFDPASWERDEELVERGRFSFPRQAFDEQLCLADYFAPADSGRVDVAGLQIVTAGEQATKLVNRLQQEGEYSRSYYTHGLAVQFAEALAEWLHRRTRGELRLGPKQGRRYSWGYPACPELADHETLFRLVPASDDIGVTLTTAYQLVPEQSTAALTVHHPKAKYFSMMSRYRADRQEEPAAAAGS
ncbi:MAG: methionine synthase [Dehalococcoidia bacterium]|nr:methionine synthase [Dehalococcoidia bacterium]